MLLAALFSLVTSFQELQLTGLDRWESQARFWMTQAETQLYDSLELSDKEKFKGYFVARRLENPQDWSETGLQLPHFYIPKNYGDIRDALIFSLGKPEKIIAGPYHAKQPSAWEYEQYRFEFLPQANYRVQLNEASSSSWEAVKKSLVRHPEIRYDFRDLTIGRNRLPLELKWIETGVTATWRIPETQGTRWRVAVRVPDSFHTQFSEKPIRTKQNVEMLVFLKTNRDQPRTLVESHFIRHDAKRMELADASTLTFETTLPPGRFVAEILIYSGFLPTGLRAETTVTTLPESLPRIGDPMICEQWRPAGIALDHSDSILAGDTYYQPALNQQTRPGRVLVASPYKKTELWLQRQNGGPKPLAQIEKSEGWAVFECPTLGPKDRLLALGYPSTSPGVALSSKGPFHGVRAAQPPSLDQAGSNDYVRIEQLNFSLKSDLSLLSVNGEPLLGSVSGQFPWPAFDWGPSATLRLEYGDQNRWQFAEYPLRRNQVFQEIRVQPKYLVAGVRDLKGQPANVPIEVKVEGLTIPPEKRSSLSDVPKLWGIVVSDPLLKSPAWGQIRDTFQTWLRRETSAEDMVYIVHIATRPRLVLAPTKVKALAQATLNSLHSKVQLENYFTVRYLFDGLTQLPQHQTRPHQVLLLTHQLTEEVSQMETLLPILRDTGLQLYNLEFPFEFQSESEDRLERTEADPILAMKVKEDDDQWRYGPLRDNIQESRNVTAGFKFVFRTKGQKRDAKEEAIRREAFHRAFNQQLASLTAGMTFKSGSEDTPQNVFLFLEQLTAWQDSLVHIRLPLPFVSSEMIQIDPGQGYSAAWTLVTWDPNR